MPDPPSADPARIGELGRRIRDAHGIVVLTGAGVSAESGVPTFRGSSGVWKNRRVEQLATPDGFRQDPRAVWEWYEDRRRGIRQCRPNPAHQSLARLLLDREDVTLVTQNVDGLHERALVEAGAVLPHPRLLRLHGSLFRIGCSSCTWEIPHTDEIETRALETLPRCAACGELARPAVVWFGEMLPAAVLERAFERASDAAICLVVGTSALVHPAASLPSATLAAGGTVVEINPSPTPLSSRADEVLRDPAGEVLPRILSGVH